MTIVLILIALVEVAGQTVELIGIDDHSLVSIDPSTGMFSQVADLDLPQDALVKSITYDPDECRFYGLIDHLTKPTFFSFDWLGKVTIIGPLSLNGQMIALAEGLSHHPGSGNLYAAASILTGPSSGDYTSESLVKVDPANAQCSMVGTIWAPNGEQDMDGMVIQDQQLVFLDGRGWSMPFTYIFQVPLSGNLSSTLAEELMYLPEHWIVEDLASMEDRIWFGNQGILYAFDPVSKDLETIGPMVNLTISNLAAPISAMTGTVIPDRYAWTDPIIEICPDGQVTLSNPYPGSPIIWSTGSNDDAILIDQAGEYSALIMVNGCPIRTDSATVLFLSPSDSSCLTMDVSHQIYYPTSFSPNGDGINDVWRPFCKNPLDVTVSKIQIWDRWGEVLYEAAGSIQDIGWDGRFRHEDCPSAIYVFTVAGVGVNGDNWSMSGDILLVRE